MGCAGRSRRLSAEQHAADRDDRQKQPVTLQFRNAGIEGSGRGLGKAAHVNFVFDKDVRNDPHHRVIGRNRLMKRSVPGAE